MSLEPVYLAFIMDGKVDLIDAKGNKVMVDKADVNAGNDVVHVIGVLLLS